VYAADAFQEYVDANDAGIPIVFALSDDQIRMVRMVLDNGPDVLTRKPMDVAKNTIIKNDWVGKYNLSVDWSKHRQKPPRKIDLVKKMAKQEIVRRLKKYPEADLVVFQFDTYPTMILDSKEMEVSTSLEIETSVEASIETMEPGGGTSILRAIAAAVQAVNKRQSPVFAHHVIVVSDGEDDVSPLRGWLDVFKEGGIVLDYIHIGNSYEENETLKQVCKATGGSFVVVTNEKEFEDRFVEAARRRLLTA